MSSLNRRIYSRSLTDERAVVVFEAAELDCVIRDRSAGGARLVLKMSGHLPPSFQLKTRHGLRLVELIWSDGLQAGVRFEVSQEVAPTMAAKSAEAE